MIRTIVAVAVALVSSVYAMAQTPDEYIYFDLAAGNITFSSGNYTGYVYVAGVSTKVTATHDNANRYYIYQSSIIEGDNDKSHSGYASTDDFNARQNIRIPNYSPMMAGESSWGEFITDNTDTEGVASQWTTSAGNSLRTSTTNTIKISGTNTYDVTIDNLWSTDNGDAGETGHSGIYIKSSNHASGNVTLRMKNDSRFTNIYYHRNSGKTGSLTFTSADGDNSTNGTLTVIQTSADWIANDREYAVIGGLYGSEFEPHDSYADSYGMSVKGGTMYVGKSRIQNSNWTNAVLDDQDGCFGGGATGDGEITINGGIVTAVNHTTSAAIGGGAALTMSAGNGYVTINGGKVYAYSFGVYAQSKKGVIACTAIGSGSTGGDSGQPKKGAGDGTVTINGGEVFAKSVGGTAIGGGNSTLARGGHGTITITGGTVTAISVGGTIAAGTDNATTVTASNSIGGGTGGRTADISATGGDAIINISGTPTIRTGSIGGGKTNNSKSKIGTAQIDISGNPTISGQFILAKGASIAPKFKMVSGTISNSSTFDTDFPKVQPNGGAVNIEDGSVEMSGGTITGCTAGNGGAYYVKGGTFTVSGTAVINGNTAIKDDNGNGGNGGGLFVEGGTLNFHNGRLTDNTALNGGGLFLASGASMTFNGGIIKGNHATASSSYSGPKTAYAGTAGQEGFGGGFYLQSGTTSNTNLTIDITGGADFGIYDNSASTGADDILAEGTKTSINIPDVKDMQLAEFSASAYPNWYEDYNASDTHYADGLTLHSGCTDLDRFVNMLSNTGHYALHKYVADGSAIEGKYLNLKLGYESLKIIISATGLNKKETAYFQLIYHDAGGDKTHPVLLLGDGSAKVSKALLGMPWGEYSAILDKTWTWAYDVTVPNADGRYENIPIVGVTEYEFPFTVEHKSGDTNVLHDEEYKVNKMLDNAAIVPNIGVEDYKKKDDVHVKF